MNSYFEIIEYNPHNSSYMLYNDAWQANINVYECLG